MIRISVETVNGDTATWLAENFLIVDGALTWQGEGIEVELDHDEIESLVITSASAQTPAEKAAPVLLAALRDPLYPESGRQFADDLEAIARAIVYIGGFTDSPAAIRAKAAAIRAAITQAEGVE